MTTVTDKTVEDIAVENYISFLRDPASLRDEDAISEKEAELAEARNQGDILLELELESGLARLRVIPEDTYAAPFIEHAKAFAEARKYDADVFQKMKVPADVLKEAGFDVKPRRVPRTHDEIKSMIKLHDWTIDGFPEGHFTTSSAVSLTSAAQATVIHAINEMIESGAIERTTNEDPTRTGPGSRAKMYCFV